MLHSWSSHQKLSICCNAYYSLCTKDAVDASTVTKTGALSTIGDGADGADGGYKVMITAEKKSADSVNISSMIDIWVPIVNFIDSPQECSYGRFISPGNVRSEYAPLVAEGKGLWWYQSCMSEGCASVRAYSFANI